MQVIAEFVGGIVLLTVFGFGVRAAIRAFTKWSDHEQPN